MKEIPEFKSLEEERAFWDTHDAFEVIGEEGWRVVEPGSTEVKSVYITRIGNRGASIRIPLELLSLIGARKGNKIKASVEDSKLVIELT